MFGSGILNAKTAAKVIALITREPYTIQERTLLVDLQTGGRRFLRPASSHTFAVRLQVGVYRFRSEKIPRGSLLRLSQARVSGGGSTRGRDTISLNLSARAQTEGNETARDEIPVPPAVAPF